MVSDRVRCSRSVLGFHGIWVSIEFLVINISSQEVKESMLLSLAKVLVSNLVLNLVSLLFLLHFLLVHLEVGIK